MTKERRLAAIVLAAGQGTRMKSALPKVLHSVCGLPMVSWVAQAALEGGASRVVVVLGHGRELVETHLRERFGDVIDVAVQAEQRGTGDAARCGLEPLGDFDGEVAILCGDVPLLPAEAARCTARARRRRC